MTISLIPLGNLPVKVSRLGLGLAALGRPGYINLNHGEDLNFSYGVAQMEAHTHSVLDLAWKEGIRYFDVAQSYGKAEEFLASWIRKRDLPLDAIAVGSKWGYTYTAKWQVQAQVHEVKDHNLDTFSRQWASSQKRLGNHLGLYQVHSATFSSGILGKTEVLEALVRLKEKGIGIGMSVSGPEQGEVIRAALMSEVDGVPVFDSFQATWNVMEPSAGEALTLASQMGKGIIIKEALANGRLTTRNTHPHFTETLHFLQAIAQSYDTTIDALLLKIALQQDWIHVVLSGAGKASHIQSNVKALQLPRIIEETEILERAKMSVDAYWTERKSLNWN